MPREAVNEKGPLLPMKTDTPETDGMVEMIANRSPAERERLLVAACRRLEQERNAETRRFKDACKTIAEYEDQWVEEHV